jgi:cell division protein FtsL
MPNDESPAGPAKRQLRFSLGQLLLIVTVACLVLAVVLLSIQMRLLSGRLEATQRELSALQPLPVQDVAEQFEEQTTLGPIATQVKDVRYSPQEDAYLVEFSWTVKGGQPISTDVKLEGDGFGAYIGRIPNEEFIKPLGNKDPYTVYIRAPSLLEAAEP